MTAPATSFTRAWSRADESWQWVTATRRRRRGGAFAFFFVATLVWLSPLVIHLSSAVLIGPADSTLSIRSYWAINYQHGNPFTFKHDYLNGAPEGTGWYRAVVIAQPVQTVVTWIPHALIGFIGGFNLFLLSGFVLTGFFTFVLLDRLGFHPLVGLIGGYVVAFNPWCFMRAFAGHAAFLHVWIYPALILCCLEMSRTRKVRWAALAGLCYGGSFLISSYFGLLGTLVFVTYFVYEFFRVRGWEERLWTTTLACAGLAVTGLCILPGAIAYKVDHSSVLRSISNPTLELQRLGASTWSYLLPARNHPVFGPITRHFTASANFAEQTLFFSYTIIVLALIGVILVLRRHPVTMTEPMRRTGLVFAAILLPLAYWSSLRRVVHPFGIPVPTLSFFMGHVTTFFRVYARFGVIVGVALVLLAAPVLDLIIRRHRRGVAIAIGLWLLIAFELLPGPVYAWTGASKPPAYDRWLAHQPMAIVAHYPLPTDQEPAIHLGEREIYFQMFHGHPLYNLFGAGTGDTREDAIRILSRYVTDPITPSVLAAEHVHYVFVHDDVYAEQHEAAPTLPTADFKLIKRFPGVRVFVLRPTVQPANLDLVLQQNAASIGLVQGLTSPTITYHGVSQSAKAGWQSFASGAQMTFANDDPNLGHIQLVVHLQATKQPATVELIAPDGQVAGTAAVATGDTQVTFGPFSIPHGSSTYTLRVSPDQRVLLGAVLVQPLAELSVSLANQ
ncbi:MAG: hypothetical protein ACJ757_12000 [Gaiellaceae bacterium]